MRLEVLVDLEQVLDLHLHELPDVFKPDVFNVAVNSIRSRKIRPVTWSISYLLRVPLGISIVTSNSTWSAPCLLVSGG
jgi:hypothetical protein